MTLLFLFYIGMGGGGGISKKSRGGDRRGMKTELEEIREMVMDMFLKNTP